MYKDPIIEKHLYEKADSMFEGLGLTMSEWVELQTIEEEQYWLEEDQDGEEDCFNVYELQLDPYGKKNLIYLNRLEKRIELTYRQDYKLALLDTFTWSDDRILPFLSEDDGEIHEAIIHYLRKESLVPRTSEFICGNLDKEVYWRSTYDECFVGSWFHVSPQLAKCLAENGEFTLKLGNFHFWGQNSYQSVSHDYIWERLAETNPELL